MRSKAGPQSRHAQRCSDMARVSKLLIIDDDPVIALVYKKQFQAAEFKVEVENDGIAGFVALQTFKPDCVLLDLKMPFRTGIEWLKNIRGMARYRHLPVVVVTALSPDSVEVKEALAADV